MRKVKTVQQDIGKIKKQLQQIGEMRPGSLSLQKRSWGGEYYHLSYTHRGKGHTEYVPEERRKVVEAQIKAYKNFRDLTLKWVDLSIELCKIRSKEDAG